MHFDLKNFKFDEEWSREAARIEEEADCDIQAGIGAIAMSAFSSFYNFKTGQHEYVEDIPGDRAHEFVSQDESAQGMFRCCMKLGKTPAEAAKEVIKYMASLITGDRPQ